ncbi:hypothetical protein ACLOJK_014884 [Asimina triloba]
MMRLPFFRKKGVCWIRGRRKKGKKGLPCCDRICHVMKMWLDATVGECIVRLLLAAADQVQLPDLAVRSLPDGES